MTLLHLITRLSLGGSARNTLDSAAAAAQAGYRTILATGPSGEELDVTPGASAAGYQIEIIPALRREIAPARDLAALAQVLALLRRERVEILHTHTSKAGFIGRLAARLVRVPAVIHTPHGHVFYGYYGRARTALYIFLEQMAARFSDRIVVLTERGAEEHLARGIGRPHQYVAIPSGVDIEKLRAEAPSRERARRQLGWEPETPILLGVGRLVPVKGFDLLVRALPTVVRELPCVRVVLVGDGPERGSLETLAREAGVVDRIAITGASEKVVPYLAAADLLVAPSRNEGMGRALVEAMALSLPVVATSVGGIPRVVSDGECGRLVPPEDPLSLGHAILDLLKDPLRRAEYGARGRQKAESFSLRVMEERLIALYREVSAVKGLCHPGSPSPVAPGAGERGVQS